MPREKSLADYFTLLNSGAAAVALLYFPTCEAHMSLENVRK